MITAPQPHPATQGAPDQQLLAALLAADAGDNRLLESLLVGDLPSRSASLAPAELRSTAEQRQIALRPFRLRTWVDHALHRLEQGLIVAAVLAFGYWLYEGPFYDWMHARNQQVLAAGSSGPAPTPALQLPDTVPPAVAAHLPALPFTTPDMAAPAQPTPRETGGGFLAPQAVPAPPQPDDPNPRRLLLPSIGVDTPVQEVFVVDGAWQVADYAAGYHHGTALPGTIGNTVLSGHAGLRGAIFRDLGELHPGDDVVLDTAGWRYRYRVREVRSVWPTQTEVMEPTATPVITLITCTNWDTQRLIVVADLVDARPQS